MRIVSTVMMLLLGALVSPPASAQTVTVDGLSASAPVLYIPPNASVEVEIIVGAAGSRLDWATLVPVSAPPSYYETWVYLNGSQIPPPGAVAVSELTLIPPVEGGPYEVRVFSNNGYTRLATSAPILMGPSVLLPVLVCTSYACVQPVQGAMVELRDRLTAAVLKRHVVGEDGTTGFYVSPASFPAPYLSVRSLGVLVTSEIGSAGILNTVVIPPPR
jgi:hypothetical protein